MYCLGSGLFLTVKLTCVGVLPREWIVPQGEVDVHAIAIGSTYAPAGLNHTWSEDGKEDEDADVEEEESLHRMEDEDANVEEEESSRRMFRIKASELIDTPSKSNASFSFRRAIEGPHRGQRDSWGRAQQQMGLVACGIETYKLEYLI